MEVVNETDEMCPGDRLVGGHHAIHARHTHTYTHTLEYSIT